MYSTRNGIRITWLSANMPPRKKVKLDRRETLVKEIREGSHYQWGGGFSFVKQDNEKYPSKQCVICLTSSASTTKTPKECIRCEIRCCNDCQTNYYSTVTCHLGMFLVWSIWKGCLDSPHYSTATYHLGMFLEWPIWMRCFYMPYRSIKNYAGNFRRVPRKLIL